MELSLTSAAADKIRNMADEHKQPDAGIRLMVVGGGCSGLTYDMDFETEGVTLYVDPMSLEYLEGTTIDYIQTFKFSGFHFENPNSKKSCGCGSSFAV